MLAWMQSVDAALFRFINVKLSCLALDMLMLPLDSSPFLIPVAALLAVLVLWKGGTRGRLFVLCLALILSLGDTLVTAPMKHAVGRLRPFNDLLDANVLVGRGRSGSMPSGHVSLWFAAALVSYAFYPRTRWVLVPFSVMMAFSRVYLGVHYPGDVAVGAVIGAGYAAALLWTLSAAWQRVGRAWFPLWWRRVPCLVLRGQEGQGAPGDMPALTAEMERGLREAQYLRLGYLWIAVALLARLGYLAGGLTQLSQDEAYQWLWSKNLALSYWSKPPLIAYAQWVGTHLWGDTTFGVRFLSPLISAGLGLMILRFMARVTSARLAFLFLLMMTATPLLCAGSVLMTVDPLLVLFWSAAMIVGWRAAQPDGTTRHWLWTGWWLGLGFLSKYTALLQIACWAIFFVLWKPARVHLRRRGPWLALAVFAVCTLPVLIWNAQHGWITLEHVASNAKLEKPWHPTLWHFFGFLAAEAGLLNPVFFVAALWAMFGFWKRYRDRPLFLFFFAMGAPVFLGYALFTLHSKVQANWIAAAVLPMFCLMAVYWDERRREGVRAVKGWLVAALALGFAVLPFLHESDLVRKFTPVILLAERTPLSRIHRIASFLDAVRQSGGYLPPAIDPLRRVRGIQGIADVVAGARRDLLKEGREVFVITPHYGPASQVTFYMPEARQGLPDSPLVYARVGVVPKSQFFFWPQYRYQNKRKGQNAIFLVFNDEPMPPPEQLLAEFESVTDAGFVEIKHGRRVFHRVQLFACRNLR